MTPLLSILLPTMPCRAERLTALYTELTRQVAALEGRENPVELLVECDAPSKDGGRSVGEKRDSLIEKARGEYVVFIDDDDWVVPDYVARILTACDTGADAVELLGTYYKNGERVTWFRHSSAHMMWGVAPDGGLLYPLNHTNPMKRSIAVQIKHQPLYYKEDIYWAHDLMRSGLVQSEAPMDVPLLEYRFIEHEYW
jgi:hypothetical protein